MSELRLIHFCLPPRRWRARWVWEEQTRGVTHECIIRPLQKQSRWGVARAAFGNDVFERNRPMAVAERIGQRSSLYQVDENLLRELKPNVILTQNLCQVLRSLRQ